AGGREHALAAALARDPAVEAVHAAPGNPGIATVATLHDVDPLDADAVLALARRLAIDLVVIGPEAPLVAGVADALRRGGVACFGPGQEAAAIEGSKAFAKQVMAAAGIPTARARVCETSEEVATALDEFGPPYVVKDDGLAGGKGVVVTADRAHAVAHAATCARVLVEEFLDGPEVSLFAICDGHTVLPMQPAQDFKRLMDDDEGPNTGGMGAYTPLPWAPPGLEAEARDAVLQPAVAELARRGTPFVGLLYAGLALTGAGLKVVEFNARFGDPETQALLAVLDTPLGVVLHAAATEGLADVGPLRWRPGAAVSVVMAAAGYPGAPRRGDAITGVAAADALGGVEVLHAGTSLSEDRPPRLVTSGGRVLAVTATGESLSVARERAYAGVREIRFAGAQVRGDIAAAAATASARLH
ncbi:MAG: phosphoribosylamine--glycine ligase, partial [Propionibacteriales bacterium]|nr:phosphoribosylamine--glycine ligase [Propionibacteriales bacterium]